jgi:N6-L-threonylcarbamoyladenine synthase
MLYKSHTDYKLLGQTKDDAVGEAYDKVAKILGLPYPGGPSVDRAAKQGDENAIALPKAKMEGYDFSFSGLKTAVLRAAQQIAGKDFTFPSTGLPDVLTDMQKTDLAASFQKTAIDTLADNLVAAEKEYKPKAVLLAGGVAANEELRKALSDRLDTPLLYPDIKLCTDNAVMIASAAYYWQQPADNPYNLAVIPSL